MFFLGGGGGFSEFEQTEAAAVPPIYSIYHFTHLEIMANSIIHILNDLSFVTDSWQTVSCPHY